METEFDRQAKLMQKECERQKRFDTFKDYFMEPEKPTKKQYGQCEVIPQGWMTGEIQLPSPPPQMQKLNPVTDTKELK